MSKTYYREYTIKRFKIIFTVFTLLPLLAAIIIFFLKDIFTASILVISSITLMVIFGSIIKKEKMSVIVLTDNDITFYFNVFSRDKSLGRIYQSKLIIPFDTINKINILAVKGGLLTQNTDFIHIYLNDGRSLQTTLHAFGEVNQKEIMDYLLSKCQIS